jgi:hypothetical protein
MKHFSTETFKTSFCNKSWVTYCKTDQKLLNANSLSNKLISSIKSVKWRLLSGRYAIRIFKHKIVQWFCIWQQSTTAGIRHIRTVNFIIKSYYMFDYYCGNMNSQIMSLYVTLLVTHNESFEGQLKSSTYKFPSRPLFLMPRRLHLNQFC